MAGKSPKQKKKSGSNELVFAALGGLGEIGMNVYLYGYGPADNRQWLMVDLGLTFPGPREPGVDVVLPDLSFIEENSGALTGIVITHAHEDHIGAVLELWPEVRAPVFATPFSVGMLKAKQGEYGRGLELPITQVDVGARFDVGPFDVEMVPMAHSIPEPSGLVIRTDAGTIFHTGDWKLDEHPVVGPPTDVVRLKELGEEGVDILVCDSTNALRDGTSPSESDVAKSLARIVKAADGRVAITTFASNVGRVKAVADAARASGRRLVVAGRALHRVINVAIETGYLPPGFKYLDQDQFSYVDRKEALLLCTGSQGEPRAAMARISDSDHPAIKLGKGDLVIFSSRNIPGNEKSIGRVQNNLSELGCDVLTDSEALVHVTGHPRRDELKKLYGWLKPSVVVPMHGEARHLKANADLAKSQGVKEVLTLSDGDLARLRPGPAKIVQRVEVGRRYRDGKLIVDEDDGVVRARRQLSMVGVVVVGVVMSSRGELLDEPEAMIDGIPNFTGDDSDMIDVVLDAVDGTLASIPAGRRKDVELVREAVRRAVRAAVADEWGKRPIVKVIINVVRGKRV